MEFVLTITITTISPILLITRQIIIDRKEYFNFYNQNRY